MSKSLRETTETTPLLDSQVTSPAGARSKFYFVEKERSGETKQPTSAVHWGDLVKEKSNVTSAEDRIHSVPKHFLQKVEPKIFFACERTFIAWMHAATLMAGTSMAIVAFSDKRSIQRQLYGTLMLPLAIIFLSYALWQYATRIKMIRRSSAGPYEDVGGPVILTITLMVAICLNFLWKLRIFM